MYSSAALPSFYMYWILLSTIIFYQLLAPCVASFCNFRFLPFFLLWASSFFCFPNENIAPLDILKIPLKDAVIKKLIRYCLSVLYKTLKMRVIFAIMNPN